MPPLYVGSTAMVCPFPSRLEAGLAPDPAFLHSRPGAIMMIGSPIAHTPYQWSGADNISVFRRKIAVNPHYILTIRACADFLFRTSSAIRFVWGRILTSWEDATGPI
jgi:hypothetical protein